MFKKSEKFKAGDKVKCISSIEGLTEGKTYDVIEFDEIASQHADATYCVGDTFKYFEFTPEQLRKFVEAVLIHYEVDHIYKIKESKK